MIIIRRKIQHNFLLIVSSIALSASYKIMASMITSASDSKIWTPPNKIEELFAKTSGNKFASINSPVAGARSEKAVPQGAASVQLYSLATPNGLLIS